MNIIAKSSVTVLLAGTILISGCANVGYGDPNYSCPGIPNGLKCMSALDVYAATDDGNELYSMDDSGELQKSEDQSYTESKSDKGKDKTQTVAAAPAPVPRVPVPDVNSDPIPVRTPAVVMKIWVAPWESETGDLITSGFIHTEVEPRRWQIGLPTPKTATTLRPLSN